MKKRVKSLVMLLASVVGIGAMAGACDQLKKPSHEHTYADAWSSDAAGHWHEATCDCEDLVPEKVAHTDANNDAVCDVCTFTNHEHTYAEDWSSDANKHWHAADCGHSVANKDEAAHADADEDGKCDVCDYVVGEIHEHTYSTEWSFDEEYHWHEANCGHDVAIKDKAAHNLNDAGDCTICEQHIKDIDTLDIESVLAAAIANENKIKSGSVTAMDVVYGGTGMETVENAMTNKVTFELGNNTSYIKWETYDKENTLVGTDEQWHQALSAEEFFGVELKSGAEKITPIASDAQFLKGYTYFPGSILGADSDDTSTLANTFMGLYNKMKAGDRVSNAVEGYDEETDKYVFAYTYYSVNPHTTAGAVYNVELEYYNVAVTFSVNGDLIIDAADFYVEVYRDYENDSDLSYTYVDNGDGTVTINDLQLKETANPSFYVYQVTQESGDRTFVNPYLKENVIPTSIELTHVTKSSFDENSQLVIDEEVAIGESIEILTGTYTRFHISGFLPETADPAFLSSSDISFSFVNKDASSTAQCWYESDSFLNTYSAYSQTIALKIRDVGEYTVTIQLGELTKVFDIIVKAEETPDVGEDDASTVNVVTTDTNCYVDLYSYTATEAGTYTFSLPAGLGLYSKAAYDSWGAPECDVLDPSVDSTVAHSVAVQLAAGETFEFYVGATTKGAWVITVSFEAGEVGGGDEEEDQYDYATVITVDNGSVWFSATEISANEATRTLTIAEDGSYKVSNNSLFISSITDANNTPIAADKQVYVLTAGDYTVSFGMFSMLSVKADTEYVISVVKQATEDTDPPAEDTTDISGTYIASATNQDDATLTIDATAGTVVFEFSTNTVNYTYEIVDGTVNLYKDGSLISGSMAMYMGVLELDADGMPSTFQYNGYTYTLTKSEGSEGGDEEIVYGTQDHPYVLTLGETQELTISQTLVDNYAVYCSLTVTEAGWYAFNGYWSCAGDNATMEYSEGICFYVEANATIIVYKSVWDTTPVTVQTFKQEVKEHSVGNGDSAANGIAIVGAGVYGVSVNYDVCADGLYVNFTVTETGYYNINCSNYNNKITYNGVEYSTYGDNGELLLYAEAGNTYSLVLDNVTYDDDYNPVETSGAFFLNVAAVPSLTVGENTVVGSGEASALVVISVETTGTYTVSIEEKDAESLYLYGDVSINGYDQWGGSSVYTAVVTLEAGMLYTTTVYFPNDADWNPMAGSWTITITEGGSVEIPEASLVMGNNSVDGTDIQFVYTAVEDGTLELTVGAAIMGPVDVSYAIDGSDSVACELSATITIDLEAGEQIVILADSDGGYLTITAAWSGASGSTGEEGGDEEGQGTVDNPYVVTGTTSFLVSADYYVPVYVQVSAGVTVSLDCAAQFVTEADGPLGTTVTPTEDTVYMIYADSMAGAMGQLTATVGEASSEEALAIGSTPVELKSAVYAYTASANGTLKLKAGAALMGNATFSYTVNGGDSTALNPGASVDLALVAGDKVVVSIVADDDYTSITATWVADPDGTEANPYLVTALPADLTVDYKGNGAAGMVWYSFTLAEGGTFTITFDGTDNWFYVNQGMTQVFSGGSAAQLSYETSLSAGDYILGIATWSENAAVLQVNLAFEVVASEAPAGAVVYMSEKHASGRYLQVTIDAAAGTMTLLRSNMSGGWDASTSTAEYTYAVEGGTVTATNISGQVCTFTWNADGSPASITWGSAVFTNFTVQA